ncbi:MAG: aldehyde reductase [Spirosomataceae bacterium]
MNNSLVLVTGGTGFVAIECIVQLLQKNYRVRATLRSLKRKDEVINALKTAGISSFENLSFVETDLLSDNHWNKAAEGCEYVLHVASPIHLEIPKDENEMIQPAVEGTIRVLKAAREAGVKRVVMTSNFGAVGYSHTDTGQVITEESWTDPNEKGLSAYNKSKVMAEKAAWEFIRKEGGALELSVINPVGIFGPAYSTKLSSGFELLKKILDGSMKAIPNMTLSIVDVRDLADLHLRAMTDPAANGQRFLALSDGVMTLPEIALFLKNRLGKRGEKISAKKLPDWLVRIAALFSPQAKALVPMLSRYRTSTNEKAKKWLGWQPRSKEEALLATAESLFRFTLSNNA